MADSPPPLLPPGFTLLQVIPDLDTGGAEQTTLDISAAVVRAGGRSLVASRGGRMASQLAADGATLVTMPVHTKNPMKAMANAARLSRLVRREKIDLIHVRSRAPAFSALWAAGATNTPLVATYHGVYNAGSGLKRWYNAVMTRGAAVIANSEYTRDHVLTEHDLDPGRITAIARGMDMARFDPEAVSDDRVQALRRAWRVSEDDPRVKILLAGRLTRWKGQGLLIDAAARVKARGRSDFLILMAGDDQGRAGYRAELEQAIATGGLQDAVRLVGHCADMPAAYLVADLAAAPSLDPEAFGRTAVEPQAMGRPVLAANHGAARETVVPGDTGWLVSPGDAAAWALALEAAISVSPDMRRRMGQAARERAVRLYSVETMCAATLSVYAQVLKSQRRAKA
jgi:glycosyltransferase involved in cell wall biosynthesis